jgi:hypothetical protein
MIIMKLALLAATAITIVVASAASSSTGAEAQIAIGDKGVKVAEGQIVQEAGHWGIVNSAKPEACTNEVTQAKVPEEDRSTGDQVLEAGEQTNECDVTQNTEINNFVINESTNNAEPPVTQGIEVAGEVAEESLGFLQDSP